MRIERKVVLPSLLWFLILSAIPVWEFATGGMRLYLCVLLELFAGAMAAMGFRQRRIGRVLYESDDEKIAIKGCKERALDPDVILRREIVRVEQGKRQLVICTSDGARIWLKALGRYSGAVRKDIEGKMAVTETE